MLSVRKSALQCATDVLNVHPGVQEVREMWVEGVFPRVDDNETSVQEKTFLLMEEKILQGVISQNVQDQSLSWDLLAFLSTEKGNRLRIYLQKAIRHWNRQQKVTKTLVQKIVYNLNNDDRKVPAWMTLKNDDAVPQRSNHSKACHRELEAKRS
uniref:Condensin complex subunit 1 C-terminal domain-containing protein n=1 Tax=Ciona savignyi TaxID=51511 RepID=H2YXJ9_CIOSA